MLRRKKFFSSTANFAPKLFIRLTNLLITEMEIELAGRRDVVVGNLCSFKQRLWSTRSVLDQIVNYHPQAAAKASPF